MERTFDPIPVTLDPLDKFDLTSREPQLEEALQKFTLLLEEYDDTHPHLDAHKPSPMKSLVDLIEPDAFAQSLSLVCSSTHITDPARLQATRWLDVYNALNEYIPQAQFLARLGERSILQLKLRSFLQDALEKGTIPVPATFDDIVICLEHIEIMEQMKYLLQHYPESWNIIGSGISPQEMELLLDTIIKTSDTYVVPYLSRWLPLKEVVPELHKGKMSNNDKILFYAIIYALLPQSQLQTYTLRIIAPPHYSVAWKKPHCATAINDSKPFVLDKDNLPLLIVKHTPLPRYVPASSLST